MSLITKSFSVLSMCTFSNLLTYINGPSESRTGAGYGDFSIEESVLFNKGLKEKLMETLKDGDATAKGLAYESFGELEEENGLFHKAKDFYEKASNAGNIRALFRLGDLYVNPAFTLFRDPAKACSFYAKFIARSRENAELQPLASIAASKIEELNRSELLWNK